MARKDKHFHLYIGKKKLNEWLNFVQDTHKNDVGDKVFKALKFYTETQFPLPMIPVPVVRERLAALNDDQKIQYKDYIERLARILDE